MSNEQQGVKMWSGRFREPLDREFEAWQRSIVFDWRLLDQEVAASKAHASALCAAGILTASETATIREALDALSAAHQSTAGKAEVRDHATAEDIHHFVELKLAERVGSLGLKLHTGRSRNEQIATDLRLYVRSQIDFVVEGLAQWAGALVRPFVDPVQSRPAYNPTVARLFRRRAPNLSSPSPGASPTNMIGEPGTPSANTSWVAVRLSAQPSKSAIEDRSASKSVAARAIASAERSVVGGTFSELSL